MAMLYFSILDKANNHHYILQEFKKKGYKMKEHYFTCPYCWQNISMLLDNSVSNQSYIEDCEVCCNPIQVSIQFSDSELVHFQADSIGQ